MKTTNETNQDDFNKILWTSCDIFRGVISADIYKDFVLTMLFLKFITDVNDDNCNKSLARNQENTLLNNDMMSMQRFVVPKGSSFSDLYEKRHAPGNAERIDFALSTIEKANGSKLYNIFKNIRFNTDLLGDESQRDALLERLLEFFGRNILNLSVVHAESPRIIGNAFKYLIENYARVCESTKCMFYTPSDVSILLATLLAPSDEDQICDPFSGCGSLLLKCGEMVRIATGSKKYSLFGQEINGTTWALAKMNMFLHGENFHRIEWDDTLRFPLLLDKEGKSLLQFDVVLSNPPFVMDKWGYEEASFDPYGRFRRGIPPKTRGNYAFISHMIETLKPESGRMGVIAPHGVLFRAASEGAIRKKLIEENLLHTVIGLPEKLFFDTSIAGVILIFKKNKSDNNVLFIDASREFKPGKNQNQLSSENIEKIVDAYECRKSIDKYAYLASFDEIKENDFNLNIPRYVDTFEEEAAIDLAAVCKNRLQLKRELQSIEDKIEGYLKELGYDI